METVYKFSVIANNLSKLNNIEESLQTINTKTIFSNDEKIKKKFY